MRQAPYHGLGKRERKRGSGSWISVKAATLRSRDGMWMADLIMVEALRISLPFF